MKLQHALRALILCAIAFTFAPVALHASDDAEFKGKYVVGEDARKITVTPIDGSPEYKVKFDGEKKSRSYLAEGDEKQTEYSDNDMNGKSRSKFIFKTGESSGIFINEKGKKEKVTRAE